MSDRTKIIIEFLGGRQDNLMMDGGRNALVIFDTGSGLVTIKGPNADISYEDVSRISVARDE